MVTNTFTYTCGLTPFQMLVHTTIETSNLNSGFTPLSTHSLYLHLLAHSQVIQMNIANIVKCGGKLLRTPCNPSTPLLTYPFMVMCVTGVFKYMIILDARTPKWSVFSVYVRWWGCMKFKYTACLKCWKNTHVVGLVYLTTTHLNVIAWSNVVSCIFCSCPGCSGVEGLTTRTHVHNTICKPTLIYMLA